MNTLVSVIVPNYNHAQFLEQRIESVLNQTYSTFEVILLDDCSTDESAAIIRRYENHPKVVKILINAVNSGSAFHQWKRGLQFTKGEWIWIAESDDYADADFLVKMLALQSDKKEIGLIYCDSRVVTGDIVETKTFAEIKNETLGTERWSHSHYNTGMDELENFLLPFGTINNTSAVLFNRMILEKVDPFDFQFRYIGDKYAFAKVLSISNVAYLNEALNFYRNPFNTKHSKHLIYYFYEQFIIFHWVWKNTNVDKQKFFNAFYRNTDNSVFKGWNMNKLSLYLRLLRLDQRLFFLSIAHNVIRPFKKRLVA